MKGQSDRMSIKALGVVALIVITSAIGAVLEAVYVVLSGLNKVVLRRR